MGGSVHAWAPLAEPWVMSRKCRRKSISGQTICPPALHQVYLSPSMRWSAEQNERRTKSWLRQVAASNSFHLLSRSNRPNSFGIFTKRAVSQLGRSVSRRKAGVAARPPAGSQRPATPTAQRVAGFRVCFAHRGCNPACFPAGGVAHARNLAVANNSGRVVIRVAGKRDWANDQMARAARMNSIRNRADEIVLNKLVYSVEVSNC